jgi:hypothetical protein
MRRQSNTLLYVVGACVAGIVGIIFTVRAVSPEDERTVSSLSKLRLAGSAAPVASASGGANLEGEERVQMLPITVDGMQGLLVRYQADVIFDPVQQNVASRILGKVKVEAEKAGVEVIVVMAVGPVGDGGSALEAQTHTTAFRKVGEGIWVQMEDPGLEAPSGSAVPALPAASGSPVIVTH